MKSPRVTARSPVTQEGDGSLNKNPENLSFIITCSNSYTHPKIDNTVYIPLFPWLNFWNHLRQTQFKF
jgi:hypothetical protein